MAAFGNHNNTKWTCEQEGALADHVASGMSMAQSAAALNHQFGTHYSRNSAIGKAHRLNLKMGEKVKMPKLKRVRKYKPRNEPKFTEKLHPEQFTLRSADIEPLNLTLLEVSEVDGCRYPLGDAAPYRFCGHARVHEETSYCRDHHELCCRTPS